MASRKPENLDMFDLDVDKCMATLEFDIYFDHDFQLAVLNTLIFNTNLSS